MTESRYAILFHATLALAIYMQLAFHKLIVIPIILLLIIIIMGYRQKQLRFEWKTPLILLISFYLAYVVGTIFTFHPDQAKHCLESKLSFVIFPMLFMFQTRFKLDFKWIVLAAVVGVFQTGVMGLIHSMSCNPADFGSFGCFTSSNFSYKHHPTYFSVFILVSCFASWYGYFQGWKYFKLSWILPLSLVFLVFYVLCLSLAGVLFLALFVFFLIARLIRYKFGKLSFLATLLLAPVLLFFVFTNVPTFKVEFNNSLASASRFMKSPKQYMKDFTQYHTGSEERMIMWTVTWYQIKKHPLGVGTGNIETYLHEELKANDQAYLASKNYNPHNQFLQTGLEIGVFGLLILLTFIATCIKFAIRNKNKILMLVMASLIFNSLFESMFQLESGIVFYSLWISILLLIPASVQEKKVTLSNS